MLTFQDMLARLLVALALGAVLGVERELVKKEAGVRTEMLVAGGAALFTMVGLILPYIVSGPTNNLADVIARNSGFLAVIANVVVGIGFLGAGLIIKQNDRPSGVTTAALVWATAAIGVLVGIGLLQFAAASALIIALLLFFLRKLNVSERLEREMEK
ncbi:MAG TPA: MgtC/SapB family protein [Candidatus Paceibacterota bacterium]|nr:MgtC/SapB family protein [Candidatus Paceibacterota bacterium]